MIIRENIVDVQEYDLKMILKGKEIECKPEDIIYFDCYPRVAILQFLRRSA